jgi:hypothetical protein
MHKAAGSIAEGRRRRKLVRLEGARRFEQRLPTAVVAAELRVSERSVQRWRRPWQVGGPAWVASGAGGAGWMSSLPGGGTIGGY